MTAVPQQAQAHVRSAQLIAPRQCVTLAGPWGIHAGGVAVVYAKLLQMRSCVWGCVPDLGESIAWY